MPWEKSIWSRKDKYEVSFLSQSCSGTSSSQMIVTLGWRLLVGKFWQEDKAGWDVIMSSMLRVTKPVSTRSIQ